MTTWRSYEDVDLTERSVVTVGNFDGVHRGHLHVISAAVHQADQTSPVVAVTFEPHPMAVLRPDHAPTMLTSINERIALLGRAGVDHVLVLEFTRDMAAWSPQEFVDRVIVSALGATAVVVGANFRFGARASGDVDFLRTYGAGLGRAAFSTTGVALDGGPQVWSSTYIRTCLAAGDVAGAAEALGRPVTVAGPVVKGDQRGRELGYPTANVAIGRTAAPADGVYAGWLHEGGRRLPAAVSVGTNPTFQGQRTRRVEAHVLGKHDLDLYDQYVEVEFSAFLRAMEAFDTVEDLVTQMQIDVADARAQLL